MNDIKDTCHRCGNRLGLGLAILQIFTIDSEVQRKLCSACDAELKRWFMAYQPPVNNISSIGSKELGK